MIGDTMLLNQLDEVERGEPAERGFAEVRVVGQIVFGFNPEMSKVAAAAPGDQDFLADVWGAFQQQDFPAALSGGAAAHHARGTGADDHGIKCGFSRHGNDPNTAAPFASTVRLCPSINGVFRPMPAFSLFTILGVVQLRLRLRNHCGLGLNRNPPFLDGHPFVSAPAVVQAPASLLPRPSPRPWPCRG